MINSTICLLIASASASVNSKLFWPLYEDYSSSGAQGPSRFTEAEINGLGSSPYGCLRSGLFMMTLDTGLPWAYTTSETWKAGNSQTSSTPAAATDDYACCNSESEGRAACPAQFA